MKTPATNAARRLREKLLALIAAPGTMDEGTAARRKLDRLEARFDFGQVCVAKDGLFAGSFQRYPGRLEQVASFGPGETDLAATVKWAIENSCSVVCTFRGDACFAEVTPATGEKLQAIAATIAGGFRQLWGQFQTFPTVAPADRSLFLRGLYDGMMNEEKPAGQPLPRRMVSKPIGRAKKKAVGHVAGLGLHPYAVAVELGRQIRFAVPPEEISAKLQAMKPKEIEQ
jgi:hypothetical protein